MKLKIGDVAKKALAEGATDEQALAIVLEAFPKAKTGINSIKTYRSQLRWEVKEGKREAGKEGPPERHRVSLEPGQPRPRSQGKSEMTPELAARLRETAERKRQDCFAKQLKDQRERERVRGPMVDRASLFFHAAKRWKQRTGFWPAPSDLMAAGDVPRMG